MYVIKLSLHDTLNYEALQIKGAPLDNMSTKSFKYVRSIYA